MNNNNNHNRNVVVRKQGVLLFVLHTIGSAIVIVSQINSISLIVIKSSCAINVRNSTGHRKTFITFPSVLYFIFIIFLFPLRIFLHKEKSKICALSLYN